MVIEIIRGIKKKHGGFKYNYYWETSFLWQRYTVANIINIFVKWLDSIRFLIPPRILLEELLRIFVAFLSFFVRVLVSNLLRFLVYTPRESRQFAESPGDLGSKACFINPEELRSGDLPR